MSCEFFAVDEPRRRRHIHPRSRARDRRLRRLRSSHAARGNQGRDRARLDAVGGVRRRGLGRRAEAVRSRAVVRHPVRLRRQLPRLLAARRAARAGRRRSRQSAPRARDRGRPCMLRRWPHSPPARDLEPQAPAPVARRDAASRPRRAVRRGRGAPRRVRRSRPSASSVAGRPRRRERGTTTSSSTSSPRSTSPSWSAARPGAITRSRARSTRTGRPSLHVFPTPERGWCCFSCGRGGSIYDLAAAMWGMTPRGREFIQIRERLQERFAAEVSRPRLTHGLER